MPLKQLSFLHNELACPYQGMSQHYSLTDSKYFIMVGRVKQRGRKDGLLEETECDIRAQKHLYKSNLHRLFAEMDWRENCL